MAHVHYLHCRRCQERLQQHDHPYCPPCNLYLAYRAMRDLAPTELDLEPIEYANGRFGEIVRAMSPELDGASARAQVARILESYNAALFATLVAGCGPESVDA